MKRIIAIIALVLTGSLYATAQTTSTMDRIEACKQNYHTLFGGEALTGQGTKHANRITTPCSAVKR